MKTLRLLFALALLPLACRAQVAPDAVPPQVQAALNTVQQHTAAIAALQAQPTPTPVPTPSNAALQALMVPLIPPAATPYPAATPLPAATPYPAIPGPAGSPGPTGATGATGPSGTDRIYIEGALSTSGKIAKRTVTSASDGTFTCTFSAEGFSSTAAPGCTAQAQATASGLANTVNATTLPPTYASGAWTVTGWVTAPNTQTLLGLTTTAPVKISPGVTVIVTAIGN